MRQRRWLELIKDYDSLINYLHLPFYIKKKKKINYLHGKANVVVDELNRKSSGYSVALLTTWKHIIADLERLEIEIVFGDSQSYLASLRVQYNYHVSTKLR